MYSFDFIVVITLSALINKPSLLFLQISVKNYSHYTYLNKYSIQCVVFYLQLIQLADSTHKMNLLNSNEPCKKDGGIVKIANIIIRQAGGNIAVR